MIKKKAFTLMEMLIVIAIIMILAILAVSAFSESRKSAEVELFVDGIISSLKFQQGLSMSGKGTFEGGGNQEILNKCYGMEFFDDEVKLVETPYVSVGKSRADYCDLDDKKFSDYKTDLDFEVVVEDDFLNKDTSFLVLFKPPFGKINVDIKDVKSIIVGFDFKNLNKKRFIKINIISGLIERYYAE